MIGSLMRLTFWGGLTLLILPIDTGSDGSGETVSAFEALAAARMTIEDVRGLCERQPHVCEIGGQAIGVIADRARVTGQLALDYLDRGEGSAGPSEVRPERG